MKRNQKISGRGSLVILCLLLVFFTSQVFALDNGLAKTPPMGWNSWNVFHGEIDEAKIRQIADAMVSTGMRDAGYIYLNLDDNWMANPARDSSGNLRAHPQRFPSGIKALSDYVHDRGLKLGIYGDRGTMTCMNVPQSGSYGNEQRDANTFASWGIDYLKYDNCNAVGDQQTAYRNMKNALANCGRPIVFSICAWGFSDWAPELGNLWRTTGDITDKWDNGTDWFHGIINCIDANEKYAPYAKPGAWNDPDMLEIGNGGCTTEEYRTQMSMWSMMAAPLLTGNDIRNMSGAIMDILLNKEIIAIDQDPAGIQGRRVSSSNGTEIWTKPLGTANGPDKAVALLNRNGSATQITVNLASIGFSGPVMIRDLWAKTDRGSFTGSYTVSVPSHGTAMLKITNGGTPGPTPKPQQEPIFTGGPYDLDGTSEYIDLPDNITEDLADFSMAAWVELRSLDNWTRLFDFGGDTTSFMMFTPASGTSGNPYFCITISGNEGEQGIDGNTAFPIGSKQHLVITKQDDTGVMYINGKEVGRNPSLTLKPANLGDTVNNYIGRSQWEQDPYLNALIDDFRIYNRAITESEIDELFNNQNNEKKPGDVNDDETVNIVDALLVAQHYVQIIPDVFIEENADVNCDNTINIVDALLIAQYYVGLIDEFCL
ncbi:MAG: alpha-galactosidase [Spirochaetales bacterium]|nr:alpha-galactosidase [Spirochaetales bacterium]